MGSGSAASSATHRATTGEILLSGPLSSDLEKCRVLPEALQPQHQAPWVDSTSFLLISLPP